MCECVQQYVRLNLWYLGWAPLQDFSSLLELETSLKCKYSHPVYPASSPSSTPILFRPSSRPVHRAARPSKQALTVPLTISNQCFMFWPKLRKRMLTRRTPHYSIWYKKCKCRQVDSVRRLKMSSQQNEMIFNVMVAIRDRNERGSVKRPFPGCTKHQFYHVQVIDIQNVNHLWVNSNYSLGLPVACFECQLVKCLLCFYFWEK